MARRAMFPGLLAAAAAAIAAPALAAEPAGPPGMEASLRDWAAAEASLLPGPVLAPAPAPLLGDAPLDIRATVWAYSTDANVDATIGSSGAHFSGDLGDAVFTGFRVEVLKGRIGALFETEFSAVDAEGAVEDLDLETRRFDLGAIFRVVGVDSEGRGLALDVFGGGRYWKADQEFSGGASADEDWWEPFLGAEARIPIPLILDVVGRLETSGYGVGYTTFNAELTVGVEFRVGPVVLQVGWRFHDVHYDVDSGAGFDADIQENGPWVGLGVDF